MEEVDNIIFPILRDIGCLIPDGITSAKDLTAFHVYNISATCLNLINPSLSLTTKLPPQKATQFRVASTVSEAIKNTGFTGEMGYQNILYPNEIDVRKLFSFLVEKVPRTDRTEAAGTASASLATTLTNSLDLFIKQKKTILHTSCSENVSNIDNPTTFHSFPIVIPTTTYDRKDKDTREYYDKFYHYLHYQTGVNTSSSVIEYLAHNNVEEELRNMIQANANANIGATNTNPREALRATFSSIARNAISTSSNTRDDMRNKVKAKPSSLALGASNFARKADFTQESDAIAPGLTKAELDAQEKDEAEKLEASRLAEIEALQSKLESTNTTAADASKQTNNNDRTLALLLEEASANEKKIIEARESLRVRRRVVDLLPESEANVGKLQAIADEAAQRLVSLSTEWEHVWKKLIEAYQETNQRRMDRNLAVEQRSNELRRGREELRNRIAEARERDDELRTIVEELNSLPKTVSRQIFIRRITDIVRNLDRQRSEIHRILADVRSIQRELNAKEESVKRSFDIADDLVYQSAKFDKHPTAVRVYRNVVELRQGFASITEAIEKTGKSGNEANDLQQKIDALEARLSGMNFDTVTEDLSQVKTENKTLKDQIRKLKMQ